MEFLAHGPCHLSIAGGQQQRGAPAPPCKHHRNSLDCGHSRHETPCTVYLFNEAIVFRAPGRQSAMARQPFLTRLAFVSLAAFLPIESHLRPTLQGRSPFESSNSTTQTPEPAREPPSEEDTRTQAAPESNCDPYTQLYNEQGTPINPGAREHGRRLRQAQNDVLSAIGVVERRPSPSEDLPGAYAERLEQLENEDTTANGIAIFFTLAGELCVWWVGLLRDRISTFRIADTVPFSQIIASEYQLSGHSIVYAGFPARLSSVFSTQVSIYTAYVLRPFDRFFYATRPTRESKRIFYRWRHVAGAW